MALHKIVLTAVFLVCGSFPAFAESAGTVSQEEWSGNHFQAVSVNEEGSMTKGQKLNILELKVKELETRIDRFLPRTSPRQQTSEENPYNFETIRTMQGWSPEDHLHEAKANDQRSEVLEEKIHTLQVRIDEFSKKPYLDTKGFKRGNLKLLKDNLVKELHEATTKTAWHKAQAKKILLSQSRHQHNS